MEHPKGQCEVVFQGRKIGTAEAISKSMSGSSIPYEIEMKIQFDESDMAKKLVDMILQVPRKLIDDDYVEE